LPIHRDPQAVDGEGAAVNAYLSFLVKKETCDFNGKAGYGAIPSQRIHDGHAMDCR
jgi:hypothetical protein